MLTGRHRFFRHTPRSRQRCGGSLDLLICGVSSSCGLRTIVADEVEKLLDDSPLSRVLMSIPGVGIKTAATILLTIGDAGSFKTAGHLAAYA